MHMYFEKIFWILVYQTGLLKTGCNDRYVLLIMFYGDQSEIEIRKIMRKKFLPHNIKKYHTNLNK